MMQAMSLTGSKNRKNGHKGWWHPGGGVPFWEGVQSLRVTVEI